MMKWKTIVLTSLLLLLCSMVFATQAESMTLAFGYEIDIPEGVEITEEAWTPDDRALMYLLTGTYNHGEEKFRLRINYGFDYQLTTGKEYSTSTNLSIGDLWLWLETSTEIQQYDDSSTSFRGRVVNAVTTDLYNWLITELRSLGNGFLCTLTPVSSDQTSEVLDTATASYLYTLDFGYEISLPDHASITSQSWTPQDRKGILYRMSGYFGDNKDAFSCIVFYQDPDDKNIYKVFLEIVKGSYPPITAVYEGHQLAAVAWIDSPLSDQATIEINNNLSKFLFGIEEYLSKNNIGAEFFSDTESSKDTKSLPTSSKIFLKNYKAEADSDKKTILVADGRYSVEITKLPKSDQAYKLKTSTEGTVIDTSFEFENPNRETITLYQYYPLPADFPQDIEYLPDNEYLAMIERALNAIGEEKADLLRNLLVDEFGLLYPELITNEAMKTTYEEWIQQIQNINIGSWTSESYSERLKKLEQAENYCRYWAIFEEPTVSPKDYLVNGHRWLRVESPLIAGPRGGTRHCAIFDGALHYAESEVNLASVKRVDDWTPEVDKTENIPTFENAQPSDAQTVMQKTVNTKSSPLTLRETPGNNGQKILSIQKGETVTILKDGDWPLVEYNGHKGYVNGKYLK